MKKHLFVGGLVAVGVDSEDGTITVTGNMVGSCH
jgi:hypothetical protein